MVKLIAVFILSVFSLHAAEIQPLKRQAQVKTCCGRAICLCTHAPGALCPLRGDVRNASAEKNLASANKKPSCCPKPSVDKKKLKKNSPLSADSTPFRWSKPPCSSDIPSSTFPGSVPDFTVHADMGILMGYASQELLLSEELSPLFHPCRFIDHPPRFLL